MAAVCGTIQLVAQAAHPLHPPHSPKGCARAQRPSSPLLASSAAPRQRFFDATRLGSPVLLDKGWRVGITANPAAALPDFDDSAWAVRDAEAPWTTFPTKIRTASGSGPG